MILSMNGSYFGVSSFGCLCRFVSVVYIKYTPETAATNPPQRMRPTD